MATARRSPAPDPVGVELDRLAKLEHANPHGVLGIHADGDGVFTIRGYRPDAVAMSAVLADGTVVDMEQVHPAGVFAGSVCCGDVPAYRFEVTYADGSTDDGGDPYRFWPTIGDLDIYLFNEGRHHQLWRMLGAHHRQHQGAWGT